MARKRQNNEEKKYIDELNEEELWDYLKIIEKELKKEMKNFKKTKKE